MLLGGVGGSRKIHAPGMEGPGKGELVHLGWEAVGGRSEHLGEGGAGVV